MFIYSPAKDRPVEFGPFPLETLGRDESVAEREAALPPVAAQLAQAEAGPLAVALDKYRAFYSQFAAGTPAPQKAPVPEALAPRGADIKAFAYFMDAAQVGICRIPANAWLEGQQADGLDYAVVMLIEHGRAPEKDNLAHEWVAPAVRSASDMRAAEIAACIAGHIRIMGWNARCHMRGAECLDSERLAVLAGLALRDGETIHNPYIGHEFSIAVVATDYELPLDAPLSASARNARGLRYWWGLNGAQSGRERNRRARRPTHLSRFPLETVKRVDRPTTLIIDDEVPQVPKRAAFFERALRGDLGAKTKVERTRFAFKHPTSWSLLQLIRALVPHQDGAVGEAADAGRYSDPAANAKAVKSLGYFLGADQVGICEIPRYAWHSHKENGKPIGMYHRYAVVMVIDQGYETMEGASGDDWISGTQSMRGYLRGAEIAGIMAELLRGQGFSSRSQTNADSDVLHIPLMLWAGLGELSRIGELVLNPFVGPRLKSVVMTTDFPMEVDKPIDFGLQTFCEGCYKCARECPCDAIPWGGKVMFNGYEMWKPDVERCARYRITNTKGSACGRCMKTCPINKVVDADGPLLTRMASWLGINAMWLKPVLVPFAAWLDDRLGNGVRNPVKKWWFDHEIVDGVTVAAKGSNQRDIEPEKKLDASKQKMAFYHANMMPPPDMLDPLPVDRKAALAAKDLLETPAEARARIARGGPAPAHYTPTPPLGAEADGAKASENPLLSPYAQQQPAK
ncbi:MAG: reductive dehalogenase domain-containing protein [Beijerinckiaceae bacterium]